AEDLALPQDAQAGHQVAQGRGTSRAEHRLETEAGVPAILDASPGGILALANQRRGGMDPVMNPRESELVAEMVGCREHAPTPSIQRRANPALGRRVDLNPVEQSRVPHARVIGGQRPARPEPEMAEVAVDSLGGRLDPGVLEVPGQPRPEGPGPAPGTPRDD